METWKRIPGFETYEVSNTGKVRNTNYHRQKITKELVQYDNKTGYRKVRISQKGKVHDIYVHRVVAECFCPKQENKNVVNHKDGNRSNNHSENLEWCNTKENIIHMYKVLGYKHSKETREKIAESSRNRKCKELTKKKISIANKGRGSKRVLCVETNQIFESATKASMELGFKTNSVPKACRTGKTSGGFHWKYINERMNNDK